MAESPTQDGRVGKLATPLGKDKLCLTRFEGTEAIGELFEYRIEAVSPDPNLDFHSALGKNCSVHLETTDHMGRDFSGILTEAKWVGMRFNLPLYRLVLRPWPWIMSLRSHCRIFANMNVKDIIKQALGDNNFGPIVDLMIEDYPTLEYTVQYRETSLNFALRMMEKFGIYYYFKFDKGDGDSPSQHYLVLANSATHETLPAPKSILYVPPSSAGPDEPSCSTTGAGSRPLSRGFSSSTTTTTISRTPTFPLTRPFLLHPSTASSTTIPAAMTIRRLATA